jgi:hypothetical protein
MAVTVPCPYCAAECEVELPEGTAKVFPHPTDGKRRIRLGNIDQELAVKIFNDFWSPKVLPGTKEISVQCKRCKFEFHTLFFKQEDLDIHRHFDFEFQGIMTKPISIRLLDLIHLPYSISCFLVAALLWLAWAIPVIGFGGANKIASDLMSFSYILILAFILYAIRFYVDTLRKMKEPIKRILKVKRPEMKGWVYERFKCYILGRGSPRKLLMPDLVGLICLLVYLLYHFNWVIHYAPYLTIFETPPVEGQKIVYTSYTATIFSPIFWGSIAFAFGEALWLTISTTWSIYKMGVWLPLNINTFEKTGGVKPLGRLALSAIVPYIAAEFIIIPHLLVTTSIIEIFGIPRMAIIAILTILTFVLFFSSIYSIHFGMKRKKEKILSKIRREYHKKQKYFLKLFSEEFGSKGSKNESLLSLARFLRVSLSDLEFFEKKVESMRTWPYDFEIVVKLIGSSLIPLVTLLLRELVWRLLNF